VAATAGRRVSHSLLEAVCDLPEDRMLAALRECVASQMLVADPADETYMFRHALMREVVHQALIPGDRLRLHRSIAAALDGNSDLSYAEQLTVTAELSYHWYAAKAYPQALEAAVRAGHDALRLFAFREAGRQFERALEIWKRLPDAAEVAGVPKHRLLCSAADAARWAGRIGQAVELAETAVSELDPMREPALAGAVYERLGSYLWEAGDHGGAERAYTTAADLLVDAPPSAAAARVLAVHATSHVRKGHTGEGLRLGRDALDMARSVGATAEEGRALNTIGIALCMQGRVEEGEAALRDAVRIAGSQNQLEDLFRAYGNLVYALEYSGQPDRAVAVAVEGLDRARLTGLEHTGGRVVLANNLCAALFLLGKWDEATRIIDQLLHDHPPAERVFPALTLVEIAVARGQFDRAGQLLAEVRETGSAVEQPQIVGSMYASDAEIAIWQGRAGAAEEAVADGLRAVAGTDNLLVQLRLYALGLRNEADERARRNALRARPPHQRGPGSATLAELDGLVAAAAESTLPEVAALTRLCQAERERANGSRAPGAWADVAVRWDALRRPYWAAYARWREAEAAAADVTTTPRRAGRTRTAQERIAAPAREAYRSATELGAEPLRREIEELTRGNRIELTTRVPEPGGEPEPTDSFGLTAREREVLAYLTVGWSNRKIAQKMFITERTAAVHVSNILRKLQVQNRSTAAAVAHRWRLVDPPAPE
jgi:DNA-binding CsgD family transcriptional regulator